MPTPEDHIPPAYPLTAEEYGRGEITRWLQRVENVIRDLRNEVVSRGVYEVERREMERDIAELRTTIEKDRAAAQLRHERLVNRAWWLVAAIVTVALSVAGLFVKAEG